MAFLVLSVSFDLEPQTQVPTEDPCWWRLCWELAGTVSSSEWGMAATVELIEPAKPPCILSDHESVFT